MKIQIIILTILSAFATCNAQISLDKIFSDVVDVERQHGLYGDTLLGLDIHHALQVRQKHHLNDIIKLSATSDTLYIYDHFSWNDGRGGYGFIIWTHNNSVQLSGNESRVKYAYPTFNNIRGFQKEVELLQKWDTTEIKRIGIKNPPKLVRSTGYTKVIVAMVIIKNGRYRIRVIDYWNIGFDPSLWNDPINYK